MNKINVTLEQAELSDFFSLLKKDHMPSQENFKKHINKIERLINFYEETKIKHNAEVILLNNKYVNYTKDGDNILFENDSIYYKKTPQEEVLTLNSFSTDSSQSFIAYFNRDGDFFRMKYMDNKIIYATNTNNYLAIAKNNNDVIYIENSSNKNNFLVSKNGAKNHTFNYKEFKHEIFSNINTILIGKEQTYELKVKNHIIETITIKDGQLYDFTIKPMIKNYLIAHNVSFSFESLGDEKSFALLKNKVEDLIDFNKMLTDSDKINLKNKKPLNELLLEANIIIDKNKDLSPIPEILKTNFNNLTKNFNDSSSHNNNYMLYTVIDEKELKNINIEEVNSLYNEGSNFIKNNNNTNRNKRILFKSN